MTHRYFYPDRSPYGALMRSLVEGLSDDVEIAVFTASQSNHGQVGPSLPKTTSLTRCFVFPERKFSKLVKFLNAILYSVFLFYHILKTRPDWVTAATFPPVIAAWCASFAARLTGTKFIYHVQDIHPEVSRISGGILGRAPMFQILRWLDTQSLRRARWIVTLSEDMRASLIARGVDPEKCVICNNFQQDTFGVPMEPPQNLIKPAGRRRVIFAGNLGRFQNLKTLGDGVEMAQQSCPDLELLFLGDGVMKQKLQMRFSKNPRIKFAPFLPLTQASALIKDAEIGLVSLKTNLHRAAYPSKMLTYLGLGTPVLALVNPDSHLSKTIKRHHLGLAASEPTPQAVSHALQKLLKDTPDRQNIRRWYQGNFDKKHALNFWRNLINVGNPLN